MAVFEPTTTHSLPLSFGDQKAATISVSEVPLSDASAGFDTGSSSSGIPGEDAVCIVGTACLLPGGISSPSDLWDFLNNKKSAQCTVPDDRFNISGFYHQDGTRAGAMNVDGGYFLKNDVRQFDNAFFGINNLEASYMDPQQRKLLEVVFNCFQNAGVTLEDISGTNTAVYVGNFTVDYQSMQSRDPDYLHRYAATGGGTSIMSNRISHIFNLQGPSLTLDTACSSSIYALHHAVAAIKNGDCDGAIVAGANLITSPEQHLGTAKGGFLSPTSTCHTFDTSADGYARAEGVNAIYIKRLSSAKMNGNRIRAIIRGTAINANGRTPGITLPSAQLQEVVIRKAYENAGLDFADTDYVEAHGTGTAVGDPIEVNGLASCFTPRHGSPLMIGSVKTNLGHSEAASGLSAILKVILAFEHGLIPPSYGLKNINTELKLESRRFRVLTETEAWPRALRRASINSFGYGGANGHVILECPRSYMHESSESTAGSLQADDAASNDSTLIIPFSAASSISLDTRRQQLCTLIEQSDTKTLLSIAVAAGKQESKLRLRSYILATANPKPTILDSPEKTATVAQSAQGLPLAFVFTGQGAQYAGMGKELLDQSPVFLRTVRELDQVLQSLPAQFAPQWTLEQTILDPPSVSQINHVTRSQPICTAVQIGLVEVLRSWGITPSAVIGHSSGEIAASYSAGLLDAPRAIIAAYFRGFAVEQMQVRGAMIAAGLGAEAARSLIQDLGLKQVGVACVNAPESVTISGSEEDIRKLYDELNGQGKFVRRLQTGGRAYHSYMMTEIGDLYEKLVVPYINGYKSDAANGIRTATMYSTVGRSPEGLGIVENSTKMATYFRNNLELPVQFSSALTNMITNEKYHFVEIGPHSALKGPVEQIRKSMKHTQDSIPYSPSLIRNKDANLSLAKLAGALFTHGYSLEWDAVNNMPSTDSDRLLDLPPYPWDYSKELPWHEPRASVDIRNRKHLRHELLGTQTAAGNGIDWSWRNIPRLSEMPWLRDHKLESQVVLPGSAYISLAIEALSQIADLKAQLEAGDAMTFEVQSVHISAPFLVLEDTDPKSEHTELHTTMCQRKISNTNSSDDWYDFTVSSWASGQTTLHCTGSIRATLPPAEHTTGTVQVSGDGYEVWSMARWYERSREEGLNFGPHFQSLTSLSTDANRTCADAIATTLLEPPSAKSAGVYYAVHPITLDACFQAAIMGGTAGNLSKLRAFVPTSMSECIIRVPKGGAGALGSKECEIHTRMETTGFSTRNVDCTVRQPDGAVVIDMKSVRLSLYTGKAPVQPLSSRSLQRHPCLQISWKPDILRVYPDAASELNEYIRSFAARQSPDMRDRESLLVVGAVLDLAGHRMPRMRVLELGDECDCISKQCLAMLDKDTAFPRCRTWNSGNLDEDAKLSINEAKSTEPFDVVLIPQHSTSEKVWSQAPEQILPLVSPNGIVVTRSTKEAISSLKSAGFVVIELPKEVLLATHIQEAAGLERKEILIVKPNKSSPSIDTLAKSLIGHLRTNTGAAEVKITHLGELDSAKLSDSVICLSLLELEREFLATISAEDMDHLRKMTDVVTSIVWLTGANMLGSPKPNLTLSNGLSRALMLEHPSLRFAVLDVGDVDNSTSEQASLTCESVIKALAVRSSTDDTEFIQQGRLLYISRFTPNLGLNAIFRNRLEGTDALETRPLAELGRAKLSIGHVGMTDTIHFQQDSSTPTRPPKGFVDVNLRAISLNAKDIYVMSGRVETRSATTALDFSGVVSAVGPDVTHLKAGDRVVGLAPNHFGTTERVPVASVHKMLPDEDFTVVPTILTVYSTALFALRDRARLRAGESVLIHAGAGAFGLAAIAMAQHMGATVYTTVGSQSKRDYLISEMGVPAENIFNSRDASFVKGVMQATGSGVDVIVNSLVGDLMHASWGCIAPFGRFVEIGKRELTDAGKLNMQVFLKNTTFTAFDLSEFFYADDPYYQKIFYGLIADALNLYREGVIKPPPISTFDISNISQAYRYFNNKDRIGKVVISMEDPTSRVQFAPAQYQAVFDPDKSYLLVGCLGGLGRSLSRWMMARGARRFVFLGRSGCDKPTAKQLVSRLEKAGAVVTVVRGDVCNADDVRKAVATSTQLSPIGGVVQAAMGLHESLFTTMPNKAWHTGIQPKWAGTWHLHRALEGHDKALDFFLMTSSLSGSCGTATESNYCSANGFLDAFAHWRRSQGKPAVSVGLGMIAEVGYLHENPEIEALLLRKGIQPLNEDEFLQVLDFSLAGPGGESDFTRGVHLSSEDAHILTGLEPLGIRKLMDQGFDVNNGIMEDPRTSILAASLLAELDEGESVDVANASGLASAAEWFKDVPAQAVNMLATESSAPTMQEAIMRLTKRRFSNLILMPTDQVDQDRPLPSFGVDSMLAAEFRTWFWNTFKVDVPYLDIVSPQKNLVNLAEFVEEKLVLSWASTA